jgi:hypothetical protein
MQIYDKTPRQWLIMFAVDVAKRDAFEGIAPHDPKQAAREAMEVVVAGAKPGTLGGAMLRYYLDCSDRARERLDATIARLARV